MVQVHVWRVFWVAWRLAGPWRSTPADPGQVHGVVDVIHPCVVRFRPLMSRETGARAPVSAGIRPSPGRRNIGPLISSANAHVRRDTRAQRRKCQNDAGLDGPVRRHSIRSRFAVWYEHAAGTNGRLSKAVARLTDPGIGDETIARLIRDCVCPIDAQGSALQGVDGMSALQTVLQAPATGPVLARRHEFRGCGQVLAHLRNRGRRLTKVRGAPRR